MKDSLRRIIVFIVVVAAGSALVLFDVPAVILVTCVIVLAVLVLVISGSIKLPKLRVPKFTFSLKKGAGKKAKEQKPPVAQKSSPSKSGKKKEPGPAKASVKKSANVTRRSSPFRDALSSMSRALHVIAGDIGKTRRPTTAKLREKQKLDQMLDQSVRGRAPDIRSFEEATPEIVPSEKQNVGDAFSTLVKEQMKTELLDSIKPGEDFGDFSEFNDLDLGSDMSGAFGEDISNLDIALDTDDGITIDDDTDSDEVASILAANKGDLDQAEEGKTDTGSKDMGLGGLEDLDINSIDLDLDLGAPDIPDVQESRPSPKPVKSPSDSAQKSPSPPAAPTGGSTFSGTPFASAPSSRMEISEKPSEMGDSMIAFSTGKGMDDDLMASLKSDTSGVKKDNLAPLLRDLKDVKVPAADLEKELEGILSITKVKK